MKKINSPCSIPGCLSPYRSKGFCRSHYRKFYENRKRYLKVKNNPEQMAKVKEAVKRYRQTEKHKIKRKVSDKKYYLENKDRIVKYRRNWDEIKRFGVPRVAILYRDNFSCVLCGSSEDLVIHHKNGKGRPIEQPDNSPTNLTTLCRSCHMKIHKEDIHMV